MKNNLLIVDDESEVRSVLAETLQGLGIKIVQAQNGQEALNILKTNKITAVISDVNMPGMKGTELLKQMRAAGYLTPLVILTAYGDKNMALEALRLGAFDFIDKPWSHERLFSVTQKVLELGQEIIFWENEVDIQQSILEFQEENSMRIIAAMTREQGFDFKKKM